MYVASRLTEYYKLHNLILAILNRVFRVWEQLPAE